VPQHGGGRGPRDPSRQARAFTIARGEAVEAAAAVETAVLCGTANQADSDRVARIVDRLVGMLTRLIR